MRTSRMRMISKTKATQAPINTRGGMLPGRKALGSQIKDGRVYTQKQKADRGSVINPMRKYK